MLSASMLYSILPYDIFIPFNVIVQDFKDLLVLHIIIA